MPSITWRERRAFWSVLIGCSLLLHASVFVFFMMQKPRASIGAEIVSAELVLGDDNVAGNEQAPSPSNVASPAASELQVKSQDAETERKDPEQTAQSAAEPEFAQEEAQATTEVPASATPDELPLPVPQENPQVAPSTSIEQTPPRNVAPPEKVRLAKKTSTRKPASAERGQDARERPSGSNAPSQASSGIGAGRSDADQNYAGLVYAHLRRFLQRNHSQSGRTVVGFTVDAQGHATAVRLTRSSGIAALDQAAIATIQRASPFPRPPSERAQSFNAPLNFTVGE